MQTPTATAPALADARWELVQRVAGSASFQKSPRLRELLLHICERAIQNRPEDLREQLIGQRVFGRKADYSPGEDNIVRVEVRQLRKRLEDFFATEGKDEPVVIVIPKGAYVPGFEPRAPLPVMAETSVPIPAPVRPSSWTAWTSSAVIVVLALVCLWLWQDNRIARHDLAVIANADSNRGPLWPLLFNADQSTRVVCADSSLVAAQTILRRTLSLEEYLSRDYGATASRSPEAKTLLHSLPLWQFTDIADVRLVQGLYRLNANHWDKVSIRTAKTAELQDFKDGNAVILGSVRSNPWNRLFEPLLNFQFDFDEQSRMAFIRNKAPLAGEQPVYRAAKPGDSGEAYSIIALVPNLRHTGSVLVIAGTTGESTEATGEFITNREASAGLIDALLRKNQNRLPYFEVLLQSGTMAGVAKNPEVVAIRILSDAIAHK
jgi:hypothetical protein